MKICPRCGGSLFAYGKAVKMTSVTVDFKDGAFSFSEVDGNTNIENEVIDCLNPECKARFNINDEEHVKLFVHQDKPCVKCGRKFSEEELNEECTCIICRLKEKDPSFGDIENAMDFNAVRMIAMLKMDNMKLSSTNEKLEKDLEKAKELKARIEEEAAKPKTKGKRGRKKAEEVDTEEDSTENESNDESDDIADNVTTDEANSVVDEVDIDTNNEESSDSDIEISDDVAPSLPEGIGDFMNLPEGD